MFLQISDYLRAIRAHSASIIGCMADETHIDHVIRGECTPRGSDREIAGLAEGQHGVVGRAQLVELGIGHRAIEERVARGRLHLIHRGVYAVGHRAISREGRWMGAVLACGPGAVLSHRAAGQLWRLLPRSPSLPEVIRPGYFRPRAGIVAHRFALSADETAVVNRIPVTSAFRTLFDLAAILTERQLEKALNEAEVRGLTDSVSLPELLARYPRRRGSAVLRALLQDGATARGITRSELEERFVALLDGHDLPRPRLNAHLAVCGRFFEVDCLWAYQRLIVELDGRAVHGTLRAFEADRERDRLLVSEGWGVIRITWRQLCDDAPAVAADLRRLLQAPLQSPPPTLS